MEFPSQKDWLIGYIKKNYGNVLLNLFYSKPAIQKFLQRNFKYLEKIELDNSLGSGHYGFVFKIKGKDLALKIGVHRTSADDKTINNIIKYQKKSKLNIFKKIVYYENIKDYHIIISPIYKVITDRKLKKFIHTLWNTPLKSHIDDKKYFFDIAKQNRYSDEKYINQLYEIYNKMYHYGFDIKDLHRKNLMLDKNNNLIVIDF